MRVKVLAGYLLLLLVGLPSSALAMGSMADSMCVTVIPSCPCNTVPGPNGCTAGINQFMCPNNCWDVTAGFNTYGTCIAPHKCQGSSTSGPNGFGLGQVAQILGPLMSALMMNSQNGSASPTDTSLAPCYQQATTTAGVSGQLLASSSPLVGANSGTPCDYGASNGYPTGSSNLLGYSPYQYSSSGANSLTNALTGSNCADPTICGLSSIADRLTSTVAGSSTLVSTPASTDTSTTPIPPQQAATTTSGLPGGQYQGTGSNISPQGLTVEKSGTTLIFTYSPVGVNAQITGFISCNVTAANAVPYIPLSAIQNACK